MKRSEVLSKDLDELYSRCSRKNWDGSDASPVSEGARGYVERFLDSLPREIGNPELVPDPDGDISLEWYISERQFVSVSVSQEGKLYYVSVNGNVRTKGSEQLVHQIPQAVLLKIQQMYS